jgi:hypothetical protein
MSRSPASAKRKTMRHVKFTIDKEYRPNFRKIQKFQKGTLKKEDHVVQMDSGTKELAKQQVLLRLTEVKILNWKRRLRIGNEADIDVITMVTDGKPNDQAQNVELKTFPKIRRGSKLTIGSPGVQLYQNSGDVPPFLDIRILIARNRQGARDIGQALTGIRNNSDFKTAVAKLSSIITGPIGAITSQVDTIIGIIGAILQIQKDDKLLYYATTLHRDFDNLGIGTHCDGTPYVELCYSIHVGSRAVEIV